MRRGLTLLELLIVLALLAALSIVVVPAVQGPLAERAFDVTAERILDQLRFARNHARANDRTVVVLYRGGLSMVELREFGADPEALGILAEPSGLNQVADAASAFGDDAPVVVDEEMYGTLVLAAYARRELPGGVRLQRERPEFLLDPRWLDEMGWDDGDVPDEPAGAGEDEDNGFADAFGDPDDAEALIQLAVFLPDGQALLTQTTWLIDDDERAGTLTIDPFTGAPAFERVEPQRDDLDDDDLDDDPDALDEATDREERPVEDDGDAAPGRSPESGPQPGPAAGPGETEESTAA